MLKRSIYEALGIVLFAAVVALIVNGLRPGGIRIFSGELPQQNETVEKSDVGIISIEDAMAAHQKPSFFFIDSRSKEDFSQGHIKGAVCLPDDQFDENFEPFLEKVPMDATLITYCDGPDCPKAKNLAEKLYSVGYEKVFYLVDGWGEWRKNDLPVGK